MRVYGAMVYAESGAIVVRTAIVVFYCSIHYRLRVGEAEKIMLECLHAVIMQ